MPSKNFPKLRYRCFLSPVITYKQYTITFVVPKSMIADLAQNKIEFVMLQEGINYFEEKCRMIK